MDNADDNDLNVGKPVIERIITVEMRAQPLTEMIAAGTDLRIGEQGLETILDLPDKARRRIWIVLRNEGPDIGKILFCGLRYAEGSELCNCCFPLLIIRSTSKSLTRPASMSDKPSRTLARSSANS